MTRGVQSAPRRLPQVPNALSLSPGALLVSLMLLNAAVALPLLASPAPPHLGTNTAPKNDRHLVSGGDVWRQAKCVGEREHLRNTRFVLYAFKNEPLCTPYLRFTGLSRFLLLKTVPTAVVVACLQAWAFGAFVSVTVAGHWRGDDELEGGDSGGGDNGADAMAAAVAPCRKQAHRFLRWHDVLLCQVQCDVKIIKKHEDDGLMLFALSESSKPNTRILLFIPSVSRSAMFSHCLCLCMCVYACVRAFLVRRAWTSTGTARWRMPMRRRARLPFSSSSGASPCSPAGEKYTERCA